MATRFSELPAITAPASAAIAPIVDAGLNKKVTLADLVKAGGGLLKDGSVAMTGDLNLGTHKVTGVVAGTVGTDGVNKSQLDAVAAAASGKFGFQYTFATSTTDADPGAGLLRFNNAAPASVTQIYLDLVDVDGNTLTNWIASLDDALGAVKGFIYYRDIADDTKWGQYRLDSITSPGGYVKLNVTYITAGAGGLPSTTAGGTLLSFDAWGNGPAAGNGLTGTSSLAVLAADGTISVSGAGVEATGAFGAKNLSTTGTLTTGKATHTAAVETSGSPYALKVIGAAHTTLAASTEATDVDFALNRVVQFATGALTKLRSVVMRAATIAFVGASTLSDAATLAITGAPVAGTNATLTRGYALWVESGASRFDGNLTWGSGVSAPQHYQEDDATNGVVAQNTTVRAQNATGTGATVGGQLILSGGNGATAGGVTLRSGTGLDVLTAGTTSALCTVTIGGNSSLRQLLQFINTGPSALSCVIQVHSTSEATGRPLIISGQPAVTTGGDLVLATGGGTALGSLALILGGYINGIASGTSKVGVHLVELSGRLVVGIARQSVLTATQMPANTGDGVLYVGDALTQPTTGAPVSGSALWASTAGLRSKGSLGGFWDVAANTRMHRQFFSNFVETTSTTLTTVLSIDTSTFGSNVSGIVEFYMTCVDTIGQGAAKYTLNFTRQGGTLNVGGSTLDGGGLGVGAASVATSGSNLLIQVTAADSVNYRWDAMAVATYGNLTNAAA